MTSRDNLCHFVCSFVIEQQLTGCRPAPLRRVHFHRALACAWGDPAEVELRPAEQYVPAELMARYVLHTLGHDAHAHNIRQDKCSTHRVIVAFAVGTLDQAACQRI